MFNKKIQAAYLAVSLLLAGSISLDGQAAATAGVCAINYNEETGTAVESGFSPFAGITLAVSDIMTESNLIANANVEEHIAQKVAAYDYSNIAIAQVNDFVYVRSLPTTESEYVGKLYNKSAATILEETEDGWYKITSGDCEGYVSKEYVVADDPDLAKECSTRFAKVNTETLFVRAENTTDSAVIDMVAGGDDVVVIDESMEDTGWVKVTCNAGEGYISLDYVDITTEFVTAESKEHELARLKKEEEERRKAQEAARAAAAAKAGKAAAGASKSYAAPAGSNGGAVVAYGAQFVGNPYVWGGTSLTNGADCSGFVMSVYRAFGVGLPHSSAAMRGVGYGVSVDQMVPGDIVCYSGHVGIYAGGGRLLNASNSRTGITYTNVFYKPILAVRRIL